MHYATLRLPGLKFTKSGKQVATAVSARIATLKEKQAALKKEVHEICQRREIDEAEVYAAGDDDVAIGTYLAKAMNSVPQPTQLTQGLIAALQRDLDRVKTLGRKFAERNGAIHELERIHRNLQGEETTSFTLALEEIVSLGF